MKVRAHAIQRHIQATTAHSIRLCAPPHALQGLGIGDEEEHARGEHARQRGLHTGMGGCLGVGIVATRSCSAWHEGGMHTDSGGCRSPCSRHHSTPPT